MRIDCHLIYYVSRTCCPDRVYAKLANLALYTNFLEPLPCTCTVVQGHDCTVVHATVIHYNIVLYRYERDMILYCTVAVNLFLLYRCGESIPFVPLPGARGVVLYN